MKIITLVSVLCAGEIVTGTMRVDDIRFLERKK
jgi:hypothetical protein